MTVSSVIIEPHKEIKNWFKLTIVSRKDSIGDTKIELLVSEETLRWIRKEVDHALEKDK